MAFTIIDGGSFTSSGVGVKINLPASCDYFETLNVTKASATNPNKVVRGYWYGSVFGSGASAAGGGIRVVKTTFDLTSAFTSPSGFTYVTSAPQIEAQNANAITAISKAAGAVVSQTNSYSNGDILYLYNTTGMQQISGMSFQISSVSGSQYTLTGLDSSGFAAAATGGYTRRVSSMLAVEPQFLFITGISKATQAVVTCSVDPSVYYVVGMKVHFSVPSGFGMYEMNNLTGTIVSTSSAAYTMTVDIDSSSFSTFAFPTSALASTTQAFPTLAPAGSSTKYNPVTNVQTGYDFQYQPFRTGQFTPYMYLAGGANTPAGETNDVINWLAYKLEV